MKATLPLILFLLLNICSSAQSLLRFVGTSGVFNRIGQENSEFWDNRAAIEQHTADFVQFGAEQTYIIPIAFHIILPDSLMVTAEQISCQINSLNEDFSGYTFIKESADDLESSFYDSITLAGRLDMFERAVENTGISFCLAQTDANGDSTTGVDFFDSQGKIWTWDDDMKRTEEGGAPPWDARKYLNIWVCRLADSVSGYAQMPGGPWETDGIVVDYRFFGCGGSSQAPYHKGKTLTHLIGNYLNLFDLWSYESRCQDDYVDDTPVHNAPNTGGDHFRHISTCDGQPMEMIMNFMDNMDDSCMYMFTKGQVRRMQAVLAENGWRAELPKLETNSISCTDTFSSFSRRMTPSGMAGANKNKSLKAAGITDFSVVPNPAKTSIAISLHVLTEQAGSIRITTSLGVEIYNTAHQFVKGTNTYLVNCADWPRGVYLVILNTNNTSLSEVLVVD